MQPVPIFIGQNNWGKECFAQYVPIKQTLQSLIVIQLGTSMCRHIQFAFQNKMFQKILEMVGTFQKMICSKMNHWLPCLPIRIMFITDDLFEGTVSFDLALFMKHLVSKEKQFTYIELNCHIVQIKYLGNDANDKHFIQEVINQMAMLLRAGVCLDYCLFCCLMRFRFHVTMKWGSCFSSLETSGGYLCACHLNGPDSIYVSPNK